ncbi:MAG TPA: helix-turn-helix domain-containing protein [Burkholderiales bacterium]|nr:helix-turn-helix domain-containing protein [Burkholderiales bacterium]
MVDDEPFVRLSLASLGPWAEHGYEFAAEASNGAEALAVLAARPEIDLLLLDLSMPVMDGLETLRRLAAGRAERRPATVVLSAHDDYHLVRQAFTLGAVDYILKAELDVASMRAALDKAASGLAASRERDAAILERRHIEFLKAQVIRDLLTAAVPPELEETFAGLQIDLALPFRVCCLWIEDFAQVSAKVDAEGLGRFAERVSRSLRQTLPRWGRGEVVALSPGQYALLFSTSAKTEANAETQLETAARAFCVDAATQLGRYLSVKVTTGAGSHCARLADAPESFRVARAVRPLESRIVVLAKRAIRERFADPAFSLEQASDRAGVSKNHLSFEFSKETGETFTDYLTRVRIEEAKRLLATTPLLVSQVGERVGYPSVEHFSRVFKKSVGVSPVRFKTGLEQDETDTD